MKRTSLLIAGFMVVALIALLFVSFVSCGERKRSTQTETEQRKLTITDNVGMFKWLTERVAYPQEAINKGIEGTVSVEYHSNGRGYFGLWVSESSPEILSEEVVKRVTSHPNWISGNNMGDITVFVDIVFSLHGKDGEGPTVSVVDMGGFHDQPEMDLENDGFPAVILEGPPIAEGENGDTPSFVAENMPTFQGGDLNKFRDWVTERIEWPEAVSETGTGTGTGNDDKVVVKFVIERDGSLTNIEFIHSPAEQLSQAVRMVLKTSPKWKPGSNSGRPLRIFYILVIDPFEE
ncbi:MAG: energy transducer TonB [Alistipes sp.]|jgi:hypothetical protein|nr:energy transducer TonB [Alistipes sp.]